MSKVLPPLEIYNPEFARALGKAYRDAYKGCKDGKPHAAGMGSAWTAFIRRFPFPEKEMATGVIKSILSAIEQKHPGWLSNDAPKRYPNSNEDARAEVEDIGRMWP